MHRRVWVIINPGSGQPKPILHTLNAVFRPLQIEWNISVTQASGDAERFARQAAESGAEVVAVFGGDGTVMEVARGLIGLQVPMAILPGGTANLMGVELGIPKDLTKAVRLAAGEGATPQAVDVGRVGDSYFLVRMGMGFPARKVENADRQLKDRFGVLAYTMAALKARPHEKAAKYTLTIDGQKHEIHTQSCEVYNVGNMGLPGITPVPGITVMDGLLDVLVLREHMILGMLTQGMDYASSRPMEEVFHHWQGRQINIEADPPQPVQMDGEIFGMTPVNIAILPGAIEVLAPIGKQSEFVNLNEKEQKMSNMVVLSFDGEYTAEGVSEAVLKLQEEGGIKIEDMAIARRGAGVDIKVENLGHKLTGKYAGRGAGLGLLAGFLLGGPIGGAALGAAAGGLMGKFKDTGIDDDFIRELSLQTRPDSSALFLLTSEADKEKVVEMLRPYKANILSTTLDDEKRVILEKALQKEE